MDKERWPQEASQAAGRGVYHLAPARYGMLWRTDHDYGTIVPRLQADVALPAGRCNEHQAPKHQELTHPRSFFGRETPLENG